MLNTQIIGRLGGNAVIKEVNGRNVIEFSVAHSTKYKDANGVQIDKTTWIKCSLWREKDKSSIAQYIKKGDRIFVTGEISAQSYLKDGNVVQQLQLKVDQVELLGEKSDETTPASQPATEPINGTHVPAPANCSYVPPTEGGDLPF